MLHRSGPLNLEPNFVCHYKREERLVFVVSAAHPLAQKEVEIKVLHYSLFLHKKTLSFYWSYPINRERLLRWSEELVGLKGVNLPVFSAVHRVGAKYPQRPDSLSHKVFLMRACASFAAAICRR